MHKLFWSLDKNYTYLDNAASTPPLKSAMDSVVDFLRTYGSIHRGAGRFSELSTNWYEHARKIVGKFISAKPDRDTVIFTGNTTDGINRLALLYPWKSGDAVLVSDIEHSSNLLPWLNVAKLITFKTDYRYSVTPEAVMSALDSHPEIRIVAIAGASNITGQVTPYREIYKICQKYGVFLFIDASQLAPHYPLSLDDCDVTAFSGHKMYAPFGSGVLAGRKEILSHVGLAPTGGGNVCFIHPLHGPLYQETPWCHETGTPNGTGAVALAAAAETLMSVGWNHIIEHNKKITDLFITYLSQVPGVKLHFPVRELVERQVLHTPMAVFTVDRIPAKEVGEILSRTNIAVRYGTFCSYRLAEKLKKITAGEIKEIYSHLTSDACNLTDRYHMIRASGGLMTTEKDVITLANALEKITEEGR